jgi:small multidrug resistance family-3 protein
VARIALTDCAASGAAPIASVTSAVVRNERDRGALPVQSIAFFLLAAFFEIAGCFAFWAWLRGDQRAWIVLPGIASLVLFALCLTRVDAAYAGRAYAAYGGIYVAASLLWLWGVEHSVPDRWDLLGGTICVAGALVVLFGPRS